MTTLEPAQTFGGLLARVSDAHLIRGGEIPVTAIAYDSRRVVPGGLFVALRGSYVDGHDYLAAARANGAAACLVDRESATLSLDEYLAVAWSPNARQALAQLACAFYGDPSRALRLVGVTGTDGKTTTCHMIEHILSQAGRRVGLIGTVATVIPGQAAQSSGRQTTPESLDTQRLLAEMGAADADAVVLETSSHGLETHRVDGCAFDVGVVTNITHEHIDFHGTEAAYRRAKARLIEQVAAARATGGLGIAVVNMDDSGARSVLPYAGDLSVVGYGLAEHTSADVRATTVRPVTDGTRFDLVTPAGHIATSIPMIGMWNVSNALAAAAVGISLRLSLDEVDAGLRTLPPVPGRMVSVRAGQPFQVLVDYAHTAPALDALLTAARDATAGRVLVLFGSGGERDIEKRAEMGSVAASLADFIVITSEDPRFEDPDAIIGQIADGALQAGAAEGVDFVRLEDRRMAIECVLERAAQGDTVILAGKGHERSLIYGADERPWDEARVVLDVLETMGYVQD